MQIWHASAVESRLITVERYGSRKKAFLLHANLEEHS